MSLRGEKSQNALIQFLSKKCTIIRKWSKNMEVREEQAYEGGEKLLELTVFLGAQRK